VIHGIKTGHDPGFGQINPGNPVSKGPEPGKHGVLIGQETAGLHRLPSLRKISGARRCVADGCRAQLWNIGAADQGRTHHNPEE
jgi:hypothetical protein